MGLEFQVKDDKVCYTPLKDKCEAVQNLDSPKTLKQTRAFCGMVNFLSSFLPNLRLLIPIFDLQKKSKKFKWTEEAEKAFNNIKELLISPPVLKAPTPDGLFHLESDTSREGVGGTLLQKQGEEWVVIGYHSKRLPQSAKNFGVTELELTGLLVNIHGFMQLLCNILANHKAMEYMIKSKTESPTTRLKTLLLKLSNLWILIHHIYTPTTMFDFSQSMNSNMAVGWDSISLCCSYKTKWWFTTILLFNSRSFNSSKVHILYGFI